MTVYNKARELSQMILESNEYKVFEQKKIDFELAKVSKEEFVRAQKDYKNFVEQIIALIKLTVYDEQMLEEDIQPASKCEGCCGRK